MEAVAARKGNLSESVESISLQTLSADSGCSPRLECRATGNARAREYESMRAQAVTSNWITAGRYDLLWYIGPCLLSYLLM